MTYTLAWPYLENICQDLQGTPPSAIMGQCGHYHWGTRSTLTYNPKWLPNFVMNICVLNIRWELSIQLARAPYNSGTHYSARKIEGNDVGSIYWIHSQNTRLHRWISHILCLPEAKILRTLLLATLHDHPWTKLVHFHCLFPSRQKLGSRCKMDSAGMQSHAWVQAQI